MPKDPVLVARSRLANTHRRGDDPTEARRALNAAHVERAIQRAVAAAPPLTQEQRDRLASLLVGRQA